MILTLTRAHNYYIHDGRFQGKEGTCPGWGGKCPAAETDGAWSDNPGDGGHDSSSRSFVEICRRRRRRSIGPTCVRLFAVAKRPTDSEAIRRRRDESVGRRRPRQLADDARCVSESAPWTHFVPRTPPLTPRKLPWGHLPMATAPHGFGL